MADFRQLFQSFNPSSAFSYTGTKYKLIPDHLEELNSAMLESFNARDFFPETFLACLQPELPVTNTKISPYSFEANCTNAVPVLHDMAMASNSEDACQDSEKRQVLEQPISSSIHVSSIASGSRLEVKNDRVKRINSRKGKKSVDHKQEVDESEEEIHVKARRGQATDKHSLAERVRREKINSKLRRLQILVPGCHKSEAQTMGMASMLDEIINYIHSLKHQVEFLSMELSAASSSYGYNLEAEVISNNAGDNVHMRQGSC